MNQLITLEISSPLGPLRLVASDGALCGLYMNIQRAPEARPAPEDPLLQRAAQQLQEYFAGTRRDFDLPLRPRGTEFQQTVWRALTEIPYGVTRSYAELAAAIGRPTACRAVGGANSKNPLGIVVPCHRVIGHHGALTGYAGGHDNKRWLLTHEAGAALVLR
jgi:methylated-DNA-[protein]-cysteine S-methyltransferase